MTAESIIKEIEKHTLSPHCVYMHKFRVGFDDVHLQDVVTHFILKGYGVEYNSKPKISYCPSIRERAEFIVLKVSQSKSILR